jgi:hypothetical protein
MAAWRLNPWPRYRWQPPQGRTLQPQGFLLAGGEPLIVARHGERWAVPASTGRGVSSRNAIYANPVLLHSHQPKPKPARPASPPQVRPYGPSHV